jgi:Flp pilus assembly protein TadD
LAFHVIFVHRKQRKGLDHLFTFLGPFSSSVQGNAAFKAGDYAAAVGHYTAAALADPTESTFFLNRAAAYLKLSK